VVGLVIRRLVAVVPMLLIVSFVIFGLTELIPGDAATTLAGGTDARPEAIERIRSELHLDDPFLARYGDWLSDAVRLDLGNSLYTGDTIRSDIADTLPVTLGLAALVFVLALVVSLLVGVAGGLRPGSLLDRALLFASSASIAMPAFWVAMLLVVAFAVELRWVPPFGYLAFGESPTGWLERMILPAAALALAPAAVLARQLRGGLADTMQSSYIRTAWAKGGSTRQVVVGHALKNSAGPAVTVLGLQVGAILGGTVLVERIFSIPGMGTYLLSAVSTQDIPAVQGVAVLFVLIQVAVSLAVDITYGSLNPKVRVS
jgi:peptide/nickel transport system permease protein